MAVSTFYIKKHIQDISLLFQQSKSVLMDSGAIDMTSENPNEDGSYDRFGEIDPISKVSANVATPIATIEHDRRWLTPSTFHIAKLIDRTQVEKMGRNPKASLLKALAAGYKRRIDQVWIDAMEGSPKVNKTGSSTQAYDTTNDITAATVMDLASIRAAKVLLDAAFIPEEDRYIVMTSQNHADLLSDSNFTSSDFTTANANAVDTGKAPMVYGFKILISEKLTVVSSHTYSYAFHKSAVKMAMINPFGVEIDKRPDLSNSMQLYSYMSLAAARMYENAVVRIISAE